MTEPQTPSSPRMVPRRALRRVIRAIRDRGQFHAEAVHDQSLWIDREQLFGILTPAELGLDPADPTPRLLLVPQPEFEWETDLARVLFHAEADRAFDEAVAAGHVTTAWVREWRRLVGPAGWDEIRTVLVDENLIDLDDADETVAREFAAFASEIAHFEPGHWHTYFPSLGNADQALTAFREARVGLPTRPKPAETGEPHALEALPPSAPTTASDARIGRWLRQGNTIRAAIRSEQASPGGGVAYLDQLLDRLSATLALTPADRAAWRAVLIPLLGPATVGRWPIERRILYDLQRACLAVETQVYTADVVEWAITLGRKAIKRPLTKTRWLDATRRLRAAERSAHKLPHAERLLALLAQAIHTTERQARAELAPEIHAVLDEVGLVPTGVAERISRDKLVAELLDGACHRGFIRIGDLRDAIARNRVKLPDLAGPKEWLRGDPLIRANRLLAFRLDGVYRRGESYMRALQRGCSLAFGTKPGRWLTRYVALPFGGAFLLLEAVHHMVEAVHGLTHWVTGWNKAVEGVTFVGGSAAGTLAANPTLEPGGVGLQSILLVGLVLFLLIHWPAFRRQAVEWTRFFLVKVPKAVRASAWVQALIYNPVARFLYRQVAIPAAAGAAAFLAAWLVIGGLGSALLVGLGVGLLVATAFQTPWGRSLEDRANEAVARAWRVISVNFIVGVLTLIMHVFRTVLEAIDRTIYAVDEWFRFREGESALAFGFKVSFGLLWFLVAYLFRFAWNLLVEPQINPIKHFPVVTVSHKMLLPLVPSLSKQFGTSAETMGLLVSGVPGIFGFLAWELKENWKLYRANASPTIRPAAIGSHGERMRGLLRPGFHSGVVPKAFAKWRKALRRRNERKAHSAEHNLDHVGEAVYRLAERDLIPYLNASKRWAGLPIKIGHPDLGNYRVRIPLHLGERGLVAMVFEQQGGWVIGRMEADEAGQRLSNEQRDALADAVMGVYKLGGVHVVREQMGRVLGPAAYGFEAVPEGLMVPDNGAMQFFDYADGPEIKSIERSLPTAEVVLSERPLAWSDWAGRWEADAEGMAPPKPLIAGWNVWPERDRQSGN